MGKSLLFFVLFHFIELARIFALTLSRGNNATAKTGKWETEKRESGCGRRAGVGGQQETAQQKASRGTNDFDSINVNALARIACERRLMYAIYGITGKRQVPRRGRGKESKGVWGKGVKRRRLATKGNWELINQSVFSFKSFEVLTSSV